MVCFRVSVTMLSLRCSWPVRECDLLSSSWSYCSGDVESETFRPNPFRETISTQTADWQSEVPWLPQSHLHSSSPFLGSLLVQRELIGFLIASAVLKVGTYLTGLCVPWHANVERSNGKMMNPQCLTVCGDWLTCMDLACAAGRGQWQPIWS